MKVQPLGDRILVKMVEMETKTAGGILIPQTAQEKTQEGVVIAPIDLDYQERVRRELPALTHARLRKERNP